MPFITQCPHCAKFNLLEDEQLGKVGRCLACQQSFQTGNAPAAGNAEKTRVQPCPMCGAKLEIPTSAAGQKVQCPDCRNTFTG